MEEKARAEKWKKHWIRTEQQRIATEMYLVDANERRNALARDYMDAQEKLKRSYKDILILRGLLGEWLDPEIDGIGMEELCRQTRLALLREGG